MKPANQATALGKRVRGRIIMFIALGTYWVAANTAFADGSKLCR
jgi:hypothetical protein